jgi:hypothetical protein
MPSIFDWSSTASSNTAVDGININTGMSPANVDNAFRSLMALARSTFATALQNFLAGTAALPVANGGTGATTTAGVRAAISALSTDYQDIPYRSTSGSATAAATDRGGGIEYTGTGGTLTLDPHGTTPIGAAGFISSILVANNGSGALVVTRGSGVSLKQNGSTTSADVTVAIGGQATLTKYGISDNWKITGSGLS